MRDVLLHRIEAGLLIALIAVCALATIIGVAVIVIRARERRFDAEAREAFADRDELPACAKKCVNAREECRERDGECLRFEPRRARKKYDPRTGEVG